MKWNLLILAAALAGCATTAPDPATARARQHDRNIALAKRLGYDVIAENGETRFCATSAATGSHVLPPCLTEAAWEQNHPFQVGLVVCCGESGRSSYEGTLGH